MGEEPAQPRDLPPHYYCENFHRLLNTVEAQYGDLLTPEENAFLAEYRALGFDAQCLYVRLVSRVGPWFREDKLQYPELGSIFEAVNELLDTGLATLTDTCKSCNSGTSFVAIL